MKKLLVICFCLSTLVLNAQEKAKAYINTYKDIAIAEMQRTGVPAAITLAQGLIESGCGEGDLCKMSNNHFGIKCKTDWTGGKVYHDDDSRQECFRSYLSGEDSYKDHSDFLRTREPYAFLFKLEPADYASWAMGLKRAGYATEKDYPQKLIKVISDYNLNKYTLLALNKVTDYSNDSTIIATTESFNNAKPVAIDSVAFELAKSNKPQNITKLSDTTSIVSNNTLVKDTTLAELVISVKRHVDTVTVATPILIKGDSVAIINNNLGKEEVKDSMKANYSKGVFAINHTKVIYVSKGTSLLSVANQYDIALAKLLEFNDMGEVDITTKPQLIYLERKQVKGLTDVHIVKPNESLFDISQHEGVRFEKILEYNKLKKETIVKAGDKILLRPIVTYGLSK